VAATITAPAEGPMMEILWTFGGKVNSKNMCEGTSNSRWNKTSNGWPDDETFLIWAHMVLAHKKKHNLDKMLIFVDNAAIHFNDKVAALFAANKIMLVGLIPSSTGYTQPLDRCHFGCVKPALEGLCRADNEVLTEFNVAKYYERACKQLEDNARKQGKSILSAGFKLAGIVPFNPEATAAGTAAADARLAPTAEQLARAKKVGAAAGKRLVAGALDVINAAFEGRVPEAVVALQPLSAKADQVRKDKFKALEKDGEAFEAHETAALGLVGRMCPTSKEFAERRQLEEEAKAQEELEKAKRAEERAQAKAMRQKEGEERKAKWEATLAERAAKKANLDAAAAARAAAKAAKAGNVPAKAAKKQQAHGAAPTAGKRAKQVGVNEYGKVYKKRKM